MEPSLSALARAVSLNLLVDAPLSEPLPARTEVPRHPTKDEPMIDQGGHNLVIFGVVLFVLGVVAVVGILSRKVEQALMAALALSLGLIGLFLVTRQ